MQLMRLKRASGGSSLDSPGHASIILQHGAKLHSLEMQVIRFRVSKLLVLLKVTINTCLRGLWFWGHFRNGRRLDSRKSS